MPAPVGSSVRVIQWGIPGLEGVNITQFVLQKTTQAEAAVGVFWDFVTATVIDAHGNFIAGYQDNLSDDSFLYRVAFIDSDGRRSLPSESGSAGLVSFRSQLLDRLRMRLGDDDPSRYQLDNNTMFKWDRLKVSTFLDEALLEFNAHPPTQTDYQFETAPDSVINIVLYSAEAKCLRERSRLELANKLHYTDGISLDIDRSAEYTRQAEAAMEEFHKQAFGSKNINRARARGLATQRLPFKVLRPLSFGPNSANLFST